VSSTSKPRSSACSSTCVAGKSNLVDNIHKSGSAVCNRSGSESFMPTRSREGVGREQIVRFGGRINRACSSTCVAGKSNLVDNITKRSNFRMTCPMTARLETRIFFFSPKSQSPPRFGGRISRACSSTCVAGKSNLVDNRTNS
jgi:hypothetical protein